MSAARVLSYTRDVITSQIESCPNSNLDGSSGHPLSNFAWLFCVVFDHSSHTFGLTCAVMCFFCDYHCSSVFFSLLSFLQISKLIFLVSPMWHLTMVLLQLFWCVTFTTNISFCSLWFCWNHFTRLTCWLLLIRYPVSEMEVRTRLQRQLPWRRVAPAAKKATMEKVDNQTLVWTSELVHQEEKGVEEGTQQQHPSNVVVVVVVRDGKVLVPVSSLQSNERIFRSEWLCCCYSSM